MINIVGIVILTSGFFAPYLSDGRFPSTVLFWIGGLLFLNKGVLIKQETKWTKWARIGILTNIAFFLIMLATYFITTDRSMTTLGSRLSMIVYWLSNPATVLGQQIFPFPETHQPDGSVSFQIGFARTVIAHFLDVIVFALVSVIIGLMWQKRLQTKERLTCGSSPTRKKRASHPRVEPGQNPMRTRDA